jgi:hypothetical protein
MVLRQCRFRPLLAMPTPQAADMYSECLASADWHTLRTFLAAVARHARAGSTAAKLAALITGWWERYVITV